MKKINIKGTTSLWLVAVITAIAFTSCSKNNETKTYKIGDTGPAGGIVFYDKGNTDGGWRYLEAAPASSEFFAEWGLADLPLETEMEIGAGKRNTALIVAALAKTGETSGRAAMLADDMNINGFDDWFLPSRDELNLMYTNLHKHGLGEFINADYWSSSSFSYGSDAIGAYNMFFDGDYTGDGGSGYARYQNCYVRAVRSFGGAGESIETETLAQTLQAAQANNRYTKIFDGDLWFTAADTGLKVTFATQIAAQEILNQFENYVSYIDESAPIEYKIIFTSTEAIDLEFLAIRMDYNEAKNELSLDVVKSMASAIVRPDRPFVVNWEPQSEFPHRAVAFYDRNNIKRYFPISGYSTSEGFRMHLNEWRASPPQEAQQYNAADLIHWWRFESGSNLLFFQSNMTFEFISDGSVKVYFVTEGEAYNLINEGTWSLTNGNNLFIEGEKGLGGGTPSYSFTFTITGDILIMTDHAGNTAVFRRFAFAG